MVVVLFLRLLKASSPAMERIGARNVNPNTKTCHLLEKLKLSRNSKASREKIADNIKPTVTNAARTHDNTVRLVLVFILLSVSTINVRTMEFLYRTLRSRTPAWKHEFMVGVAGVVRIFLVGHSVRPNHAEFTPNLGGIGKSDLALVR